MIKFNLKVISKAILIIYLAKHQLFLIIITTFLFILRVFFFIYGIIISFKSYFYHKSLIVILNY